MAQEWNYSGLEPLNPRAQNQAAEQLNLEDQWDYSGLEPLEGIKTGERSVPGNIDLFAQPRVKNKDGSISTVASVGFQDEEGGPEIVIPTVAHDGSGILSFEDAIEQYRESGKHLGMFDTVEEGTAYAQQLHTDYENGVYDKRPEEKKPRSTSPGFLRGLADLALSPIDTAQDIAVASAKGIVGLGESAVGLADLVSGGHAGKFLEDKTGYDPAMTSSLLDTYFSESMQSQKRTLEEAEGFVDIAITALQNPRTVLGSVVESLPLMGGGAAVARKLVARGIAPVIAGAIGEGLGQAGGAAEGTRQQTESGLLSPKQAGLAAASGVVTGLLGIFGGKLAEKLGIIDLDTMLAGAVANKIARGNLVRGIIAGAVQEGFLEELPQSVQEQVMSNLALDKDPWEGVDHAAVMGALAGIVMGGGGQLPGAAAAFGGPPPPVQTDTGPSGTGPYTPTPELSNVEQDLAGGADINADDDGDGGAPSGDERRSDVRGPDEVWTEEERRIAKKAFDEAAKTIDDDLDAETKRIAAEKAAPAPEKAASTPPAAPQETAAPGTPSEGDTDAPPTPEAGELDTWVKARIEDGFSRKEVLAAVDEAIGKGFDPTELQDMDEVYAKLETFEPTEVAPKPTKAELHLDEVLADLASGETASDLDRDKVLEWIEDTGATMDEIRNAVIRGHGDVIDVEPVAKPASKAEAAKAEFDEKKKAAKPAQFYDDHLLAGAKEFGITPNPGETAQSLRARVQAASIGDQDDVGAEAAAAEVAPDSKAEQAKAEFDEKKAEGQTSTRGLTVEKVFGDRLPVDPAARRKFLEDEFAKTPDVTGRTRRADEVIEEELRRLVSAARPPTKSTTPRLPQELAGAKPRYKSFELEFESDIDRAAYIVSQPKKSKRDADYLTWLKGHGVEADPAEYRGGLVREAIRGLVAGQDQGATVRVPNQQAAADRFNAHTEANKAARAARGSQATTPPAPEAPEEQDQQVDVKDLIDELDLPKTYRPFTDTAKTMPEAQDIRDFVMSEGGRDVTIKKTGKTFTITGFEVAPTEAQAAGIAGKLKGQAPTPKAAAPVELQPGQKPIPGKPPAGFVAEEFTVVNQSDDGGPDFKIHAWGTKHLLLSTDGTKQWTVTHRPTTYSMTTSLNSKAEAVDVIRALEAEFGDELGFDGQKDMPKRFRDEAQDVMRKAVRAGMVPKAPAKKVVATMSGSSGSFADTTPGTRVEVDGRPGVMQAQTLGYRGGLTVLFDGEKDPTIINRVYIDFEVIAPPEPKKPVGKSKPEKKPATKIGKNREGVILYEDENGVRSYVENGIRSTEAVRIVPGQGLVKRPDSERPNDYRLDSEPEVAQPDAYAGMDPKLLKKPTPQVPAMPGMEPRVPTGGRLAPSVGGEPSVNDKRRAKAAKMRADAQKRLNDRGTFGGTKLSMALDPADLADLATIGYSYILDGAANLSDFKDRMVAHFGDDIVPYLRQVHAAAKVLAEEDADETTDDTEEAEDDEPHQPAAAFGSYSAEDVETGDVVGGLTTRSTDYDDIPNTGSIESSLTNFEVVGVRRVEMKAFHGLGGFGYSQSERAKQLSLQKEIEENREITPLIVVDDKDGLYILEGGHRADALARMKVTEFPALIVKDLDSLKPGQSAEKPKGVKSFETFIREDGIQVPQRFIGYIRAYRSWLTRPAATDGKTHPAPSRPDNLTGPDRRMLDELEKRFAKLDGNAEGDDVFEGDEVNPPELDNDINIGGIPKRIFNALPDAEHIPKRPQELRALVKRALPDLDVVALAEVIDDAVEAKFAIEATRQILAAQGRIGAKAEWVGGVHAMADLEKKLPMARRGLKKTELQQFSTPLTISYLATRAAAVQAGDIVLEPTAGTGNLVIGLKQPGVSIHLNELDPVRAELLSAQGYQDVSSRDYIRQPRGPGTLKPSVIVTNPPWGKYSKGKYGTAIATDFTPRDVAERFVALNMRDLADGGRLVAVLPTTIGPSFRNWLNTNFAVRAMIQSPPGAYDTRATTVDSILLVVDKVANTQGVTSQRLKSAETLDEYARLVSEIPERAEATNAAEETGPTQSNAGAPVQGATGGSAGQPPGRGGGRGATGQPGPASVPGRGPDVVPVKVPRVERPAEPPLEKPRAATSLAAPNTIKRDTTPERAATLDRVRASEFFAPYGDRSDIAGNQHPRIIVEAKAFAGAPYPELTYRPQSKIVKDAIKTGRVSVEQAEQAMALVQANENGHGFLVADGTGVGKSRELALAVVELMDRAERNNNPLRLLVTSKSKTNIVKLIEEEFHYVASGSSMEDGGSMPFPFHIVTDYKASKAAGELFEPLPSMERGIYAIDSHNLASYRTALETAGIHGIVGDEAHTYRNKDAQLGATWKSLHAQIMQGIPRAQQVFGYFTATPAESIYDYEYLYGLRLWPVDGFSDYVSLVTGEMDEADLEDYKKAVEAGTKTKAGAEMAEEDDGVGSESEGGGEPDDGGRAWGGARNDVFASKMTPAEAEQIPREWKMKGRMSARDLWREGTEYSVHRAELPDGYDLRYEQFAELARNIYAASKKFGAMNKTIQTFGPGGQLQFASKRLQLEPAIREAIKIAQAEVAAGHQVVLSLINVNEADAAGGNIGAAIRGINTQEVEVTEDGEINDLGEIPEALIAQAELLEQAEALGSMASPLELVEAAFGRDQVAFLVGDNAKHQKRLNNDFQEGTRKVAVISAAASTGIDLHHVKEAGDGAKGRRVFIDVQYEWSATKTLQRMGRVDRTGQITPPRLISLTFGQPAEAKFLATIANRMAQTGALSRGGADSTGSALDEFEIGGNDALQAMRDTWNDQSNEEKEMWVGSAKFLNPNRGPDTPQMPAVRTVADLKTLQLAMLWLPPAQGRAFYSKFLALYERLQAQSETHRFRRSLRSAGEVLRKIELGPERTLFQVKSAGGQKFGILQGMVSDQMPIIARANILPVSDNGVTQRHYLTFTANDGEIIAGLQIPWGKVKRAAALFGRMLEQEKVETASEVLEVLRGGENVTLQQQTKPSRFEAGGVNWYLRLRSSDGIIQIHGPKMADRDLVDGHGVSFRAVGSVWHITDHDSLEQFLERFPVRQDDVDINNLTDDEASALPEDKKRESSAMPPTTVTPGPSKPLAQVVQQGPVTKKGKSGMHPFDITRKLAKALQVPIVQGKLGRGFRGLFYHSGIVAEKVYGDTRARLHELGHALDVLIMNMSRANVRNDVGQELRALGQATSMPSYSVLKQRREGAAELFYHWMTAPSAVRVRAPKATAILEAFVAEAPDSKDKNIKQLGAVIADMQGQIQEYQSLAPADQLGRFIKYGGKGTAQKVKEWWSGTLEDSRTGPEQLVDALNDSLAPLYRMDRKIQDQTWVDIPRSAYYVADLARSADSKAEAFLKYKVRHDDMTEIGPGLAPALEGVDRRDLSEFMTAVKGQRAHDLGYMTGLTDAQLSATFARTTPEVRRAAQGVAAHQDAMLTYAESKGVISARLVAVFRKKWGATYVPWKRVSEFLAQQGAGHGGGKNMKVPFRRFYGAMAPIHDPIRSIIENDFAIVRAAERNEATREVLQLAVKAGAARAIRPDQIKAIFDLDRVSKDIREVLAENGVEVPDEADFSKMVSVYLPQQFAVGNNRYMTVLEEGDRKWYEVVDQGVYESLTDHGPGPTGILLRFAAQAAKILRVTATGNIRFIIRNPLRDYAGAIIYTRSKGVLGLTPSDIAHAAHDVLFDGEQYQKFLTSRAGQATYSSIDLNYMDRAMRKMSPTKLRKFLDSTVLLPWHALITLKDLGENVTRVAEFTNVERQQKDLEGPRIAAMLQEALGQVDFTGLSPAEQTAVYTGLHDAAASRARVDTYRTAAVAGKEVSQNFQRMGYFVREWNRYTAFIGARIGGWTRFVDEVRKNPGRMGRRALMYSTLPTMALWYLNSDDDEYEKWPGWMKAYFLGIPVPEALRAKGWPTHLLFPRAFEFGDLDNTLEAMLDYYAKGKSKEYVLDRLPFRSRKEAFIYLIGMLPNMILPELEVAMNYDTFQGRPIISPFDTALAAEHPELMYNRWTSETAKWLGKMTGMAPVKWDHLIYGHFSSYGRGATWAIDRGLSMLGVIDEKPGLSVSEFPGIGGFVSGPAVSRSNFDVNHFYQEYNRVDGNASLVRRHFRAGRSELAIQKAREYGFQVSIQGLGELNIQNPTRLPARTETALIEGRGRLLVDNAQRKRFREAANALGDMRGREHAIYLNKRLNGEQKRERLDSLYLEMWAISRRALGKSPPKRLKR